MFIIPSSCLIPGTAYLFLLFLFIPRSIPYEDTLLRAGEKRILEQKLSTGILEFIWKLDFLGLSGAHTVQRMGGELSQKHNRLVFRRLEHAFNAQSPDKSSELYRTGQH